MSINFQEILKELEYRVEHGIIDLTNEEQVTKLAQILKESGVVNANQMAQKARVYFSYINEAPNPLAKKKPIFAEAPADIKGSFPAYSTAAKRIVVFKSKKSFDDALSSGKYSKPTPQQIKAQDAMDASGEDGKSEKPAGGKPGQQKPVSNIPALDFKSSAEKRASADVKQPTTSDPQKKKEIDKINIEAGQSRTKFYDRGYFKAESDDESGSAPGNAGSMLNENGSCDVCEFALENDNFDLMSSVKHLRKNLGNGALLTSADKSGIAGQMDRVPSISAGELKQFRADSKGIFNDLHDGQLSRLMIAATAGLLKAKDIKQGISKLGWKEENTTVSGFFGDRDGKRQQLDMAKAANRIFAPSGQEIPKSVALQLINAGGGGANPSDTSQFAYNDKTGDLMIKFTSDKDSFGAIVAQSSFAKEGLNKKNELDKMVKTGKISAKNADVLKKTIDKYTTKLNGIEEELKFVVAAPAKKMLSKSSPELLKLALQFNKSDSGKSRLAAVSKKYGAGGDGIKNLLKTAAASPESLSAGDRRIVDDLKKHYGLDYLVAENIDNIRKRSVAIERNLLNEMNKVPIKLGNGGKVGLGNYLDATNFVEKFHMSGALGDKHGVFAYGGLFDVVCGKGKITNDIIASCIGTKSQDDFIQKFGSEKEEFQLSKENAITGSVRIAYFLNDKKQKIRLGEKRQRSKTGATGRFNTVYKWDNDTIGCFQRKNGLK